jgi:hypothetical protein
MTTGNWTTKEAQSLTELIDGWRAIEQMLGANTMTTHKVGCTGKKAFIDFRKAQERAKVLNRKQEDAHVEAYHCQHCNCHHIGEARSYGHRRRKDDVSEG